MQHVIYVLRWILFAIPGAILLDLVYSLLVNTYFLFKLPPKDLMISMIISQAILGFFIYYIDKLIFVIK